MPSLPQHPQLPPDPEHAHRQETSAQAVSLIRWAVAFQRAFVALYVRTIYVINALCKADTLANRTSTPALDEIFYYETNSKALSVGSAGAWVHVGPRRGSATIAAGNTTVGVTLSPNEPNANYRISLSTNYDHGRMWWTSKAASGWTINVATVAPVGGATVDWILMRD